MKSLTIICCTFGPLVVSALLLTFVARDKSKARPARTVASRSRMKTSHKEQGRSMVAPTDGIDVLVMRCRLVADTAQPVPTVTRKDSLYRNRL